MDDILDLSWSVQFALATGYIAYVLAYSGIKAHHTSVDTTFSTLTFSAIATSLSFISVKYICCPEIVGSIVGFIVTVIIALLWRRYFRRWIRTALHSSRISHATDTPSAWKELFDLPMLDVTQIAVQMKNGTWLRCDDTSLFNDAPVSPLTLGADGGILMYLTHEQKLGEAPKELKTVLDNDYGARITYIPPSEVSQVNIRYKKPS